MLRQIIVALGVVAVSITGRITGSQSRYRARLWSRKIAWADFQNQKNIAPQVMMATTNGTGMNTFGISPETLAARMMVKCRASERIMFALLNPDNLSQEMAQGKGEHLAPWRR